jgi:hydroxyacylglutathione hydrolase
MSLPLEDHFEDVVGKAMRGMGLSDGVLEFLSGVPEDKIVQLKEGIAQAEPLRQIAPPLGLDGESLVRMSEGHYAPKVVEVEGLRQVSTEYDDMIVNAYLSWDPATKEAIIFDTGANADPLIALVEELGLKPMLLLLTHTHQDHIMDRAKILARYPEVRAWINGREACRGAERFETGKTFSVGALTISTRSTWGHSPSGTTYVIEGLSRPVAMVGDAIFAGSMGGGVVDYQAALATNRAEIFTLSDETVVCPGHGPMTSVGEEKANNPFYPEFK